MMRVLEKNKPKHLFHIGASLFIHGQGFVVLREWREPIAGCVVGGGGTGLFTFVPDEVSHSQKRMFASVA